MVIISPRHPVYLWLLLGLALILLGYNSYSLLGIWQHNQLIDNPALISKTEKNLPVEVLFAEAFNLNQQGKFQEALRLYDQIENHAPSYLQENIRYNMGTIYLQQAAQDWNSKGVFEYKQINTMLDLAEQSLRQVVLNNPQHWQARFNLEYALRIRPPAKLVDEADWQGQKASVHAIMPGIPAGGP